MKKRLSIIALTFLFASPCLAQTPPQLDMFGNLTGVACPASASWINTTVSSGAVTGSTTAQNISLTSITGVAAGNWLTIDAGAAPVQVTGEALGTVVTGTTQYKVTLAHGNYLPGTAVLKVNGVIVAYDQGAKTTPALAGQLQTGILVDAGLVTTGTSSGNMAAATGGSTDATAYPNFMSVQRADPVAPGGGVADQEFINIVFAAGFDTAHNGQTITEDYKYSPAEFFVVPSLTGSQLNSVVLLNNHAANAPITQGTWYTAKVTVSRTPTWVFCDPLGFGNDDFALYVIGQDSSSSHMSKTANTTVAAAVTTTGSQTVTPVSMAGICLNCYLTIDQGTASEETEQVTAVTGTTFTMTFANTHAANFTAKGYYYNGVAFGKCVAIGGCGGGLAGTTGGKYFGNVAFWGPMQIVRARGWGYNMVQGFFDNRAVPLETVFGGGTIPWPTADNSNIAKMPFIVTNDTFNYGTRDVSNYGQTAGCAGGVAGANGDTDFAIKNVWTTFNGVTTGADPGALYGGAMFPDIYDPNMYAYLCGWLKAGNGGLGLMSNNHESPWIAMDMPDETDFLNSLADVKRTGFTPDDGTFEDYGSRKNMFMPYHISASQDYTGGFQAMSNNLNNLKSNMISALTTEYTTIAALNTAWGSSYDNFGTDGTQVTGVALSPLPNGTTTTFTATLAFAPDRESIQLFGSNNGTNSPILAGDLPGGGKGSGAYTATGTFNGPSSSNISSSSITYSTGAISVTFSVAPASSANALTVNYWHGGWGVGHGLADEDGTCPAFSASCATVWGTSPTDIQADGNAAFQADMVTLLGTMVSYYSSHDKTQYKALLPHTLLTSGYSVGGHGAPADLVVYQNYCPNVDVIAYGTMTPTNTNTGGAGTQGIGPYQYVNEYCGDKPAISWAGRPADPDSVMSIVGGSSPIDVATQALRATKYGSWITQLGVKGTTTGTDTFTGINTWQFEDNYSELTNWGLVSAEDNPYDGVHDTTSGTPEMVGNNALAYTPELHNNGDFINPVRIDIVNQENVLLGAGPPPTLPTVPTGRQPMLTFGRARKKDGTVVLARGNR